jgi:exosortase D (VPLPA-CTERM-specific)
MTNLVTGLFGNVRPSAWVKFGVLALATAVVYSGTIGHLVGFDWPMEDFNYCYLIPVVVLYFLWEKRENFARLPSVPSWTGFLPLVLGILLFWLGDLGGEFFTLYISLWLVVVGLLWANFGIEKVKTIWFALVMMLGMFPLPSIINVRLTFGLKLISSQLGVALLHLYGMTAYREGNVIDLGFAQLQVVEACSGLRYLMPLAVLSLILAYESKAHLWKKLFLFASSVPISIGINSARIALTGMLYTVSGGEVAEGFFHGFSGWLIFMAAIPILLLEMWILGKLPPRERPRAGSDDEQASPALEPGSVREGVQGRGQPPARPVVQASARPFVQPIFIAALVLLCATAVLSRTVEFREKVPLKKPLSSLPLTIGEWTGQTDRMEQGMLDQLNLSDYAMVDYQNRGGKTINFYTAYYESQSKGQTTHSPETCLPANGWEFREAGATDVPLGTGRSMRVSRAYVENAGSRQLVYYWFAQRGRVLTNLYQVKIYSVWDSLTRHRTDGALVRLITPVYGGESPSDAETRLQGFTSEIVPILRDYVPE